MTPEPIKPYRVLARKYRPQNFEELIGQEALVRTLKNAIESGRIAHAFMLTGVRGVGKTTTARIIARALNYTGPDGKAGPTAGPTDDCALCRAIAEDRHPDVMEMDAASRTGVDDIREILDGVRYAPTEARYKIYIIDEVHMLSKNAFNALLKTLEEPPAHVKFIFATTEIRKVPVTVLSRCQRFDLRRVDIATLSTHYGNICQKENVTAQETALQLIARAADGSVRDGLSILDQAIAMSSSTQETSAETAQGDQITTALVEKMLGLADRARNLDLLERLLSGDIAGALDIAEDLNRSGGDPVVLIQDLLDLTHKLTRLRAAPTAKSTTNIIEDNLQDRLGGMAAKLSIPVLAKTWQILLKGLAEVQSAPRPQSAAELILIRLAYAADLPDPAELLRKLQNTDQETLRPAAQTSAETAQNPLPQGSTSSGPAGRFYEESAPAHLPQTESAYRIQPSGDGGERAALALVPSAQPETLAPPIPPFKTLEDVVAALEAANEVLLANQVYHFAHLVKIENAAQAGRIEIRPGDQAPPRLAQDLGQTLSKITERRWIVSISGATGAPTLAQTAEALQNAEIENVKALPAIREILSVFPEAEIRTITRITPPNNDERIP
ncbi:MAG: DNA polymerase III subunit gamma/tau [Alphaproteobacteria bacterium]|nr:DNA polymerase III subunit gamma/tau [Alphaproteobacteria bacterium]